MTLPTPACLRLDGINLLNLSLGETVDAIDAALTANLHTRIAFANADCMNIASRDRQYRRDLSSMDWILVDGIGMRIAGSLFRQRVRDNVNGTDLFPLLCRLLQDRQGSLFLLGGLPGVAADAAHWAESQFAGLRIVGHEHGYLDESAQQDVVRRIHDLRPDILLVGLGAPRQERWITTYAESSGAIVTLGVGGLFDYYAGRIPRAPGWMRRCGLEWVFRLAQEPQRLWRRYLVGNGLFLARYSLRAARFHLLAQTSETSS